MGGGFVPLGICFPIVLKWRTPYQYVPKGLHIPQSGFTDYVLKRGSYDVIIRAGAKVGIILDISKIKAEFFYPAFILYQKFATS